MKKFIVKHSGQKRTLLMSACISLFLGLYSFKYIYLTIFNSNTAPILEESDFVSMVNLMLAVILFLVYLIKHGMVVIQSELYTSKFLFGKPFNLKPVDIELFKDIDILKYNFKSYNEFGDQTETDKDHAEFKVFLLNESHSSRKLISKTFNKEEALSIKAFLVDELGVKPNKYNPPSSRRRKRR